LSQFKTATYNDKFDTIMSVRLYIGNLSFDATGDDLREIFANCGAVEEAIIVTRPGGGRPRGFGFVTMDDSEGADEAIRQLDGQQFAGRKLTVNVAKDREPKAQD
jgi:RNA recognition motif-containing protein